MHPYHKIILEEIKQASQVHKVSKLSDNYSGSPHKSFYITNPQTRLIARKWIASHKQLSQAEFLDLLNSLYQGESQNEKQFAGMLLGYFPKLRSGLDPQLLDVWLKELVGWAEIDSLCQSNFTAGEMLGNWNEWKKLIRELAVSKNISKRRAALVLLTGPVRHSNNKRLVDLSFWVIDTLKSEKDILIIKAISWLLRSLVQNFPEKVEKYLRENVENLPHIAVRETSTKLRTGRKRG